MSRPTRTLQVTYMDMLTEKQIRDHFQQYGNIVNIRIHNSSFVEFETQEQATNALANIQFGMSNIVSVDYTPDEGGETQPMNPHCAYSGYARDLIYINPPSSPFGVHAFWDWDSFNIIYPNAFRENTERKLGQLGFSLIKIQGYGGTIKLDPFYKRSLLKHDVKLHEAIPARKGGKLRDSAGINMIHAMKLWCSDHNPPAPVLVISGDPEVAEVMEWMRKRKFTVFLFYNAATEGIKASADRACRTTL